MTCFVQTYFMNIIFLLIGVSIVLAVLFLVLFIVSVKKGQFDDAETPGMRMLFEDELSNKNQ